MIIDVVSYAVADRSDHLLNLLCALVSLALVLQLRLDRTR